jgi:transposase
MPKTRRTRYSAEYRTEALALAERTGVSAAAKALGIHTTQLYQWRTKATHEASVSDRERRLAEENARLNSTLSLFLASSNCRQAPVWHRLNR